MGDAIKIEFDEKALFKDLLAGDVKKSLTACNTVIERLEAIKEQLYRKSISGYHFMSHEVPGTWDCDTSPIGTCVYYYPEDPAHDNCLFCHEPEERK